MVYLVIAIVAAIILALGYWQLKKAEKGREAIYANVIDMHNKHDKQINNVIETMKALVAKMKEITGTDPVENDYAKEAHLVEIRKTIENLEVNLVNSITENEDNVKKALNGMTELSLQINSNARDIEGAKSSIEKLLVIADRIIDFKDKQIDFNTDVNNKFAENVLQTNEVLQVIKTLTDATKNNASSIETLYEFNTVKHGLNWQELEG